MRRLLLDLLSLEISFEVMVLINMIDNDDNNMIIIRWK
jgi:hypothetical protein